MSSTTDVVVAVASAAQAVLLAAGGLYGFAQVREAKRVRQASLFQQLHSELSSPSALAARRHLYSEIGTKKPPYSAEDREMGAVVVNQFEFIGYLVRKGVIESDMVTGLYYSGIIRSWRHLSWYIAEQRAARQTNYARHFQALKDAAERYREMQYPDDKLLDFHLGADGQ